MREEDFQKLVKTVHQMGAIMHGDKVPHHAPRVSGRMSAAFGSASTSRKPLSPG
jgi:1,4-alpha-glucan branching enzyme